MLRKVSAFLIASILITMSLGASSFANARTNDSEPLRVRTPLNIAILIQDDLISSVANELGVTRDFIRSLPAGSRVMVGYITAGSPPERQPFTTAFRRAGKSLRYSLSNTPPSAYNPYVEVIETIKTFASSWKGHHAT